MLTRPAQARGELDHLWPEMLPGGRAVLFTITATGGPDAAQVAVLDLATGTSKVVMPGGSHAHYVPSGHLVYTAGGTLRAVPFDLDRLETRGTPVTVLPRLVTKPQGAAEFVVAADGTLAYVDAPDFAAAANTLVWVDRQGREKPLDAPPGPYVHPRVSPDGMRVAVAIETRKRHLGVGSRTPDAQPADVRSRVRLRSGVDEGRASSALLLAVSRERSVLAGRRRHRRGREARHRAAVRCDAGRQARALLLSARGPGRDDADARRHAPRRTTASRRRPPSATASSHRTVAGWPTNRTAQDEFEIYVKPFPNVNAGQWQVSTAGGTRPLWAPNGRELFFVAPDGSLMAVACRRSRLIVELGQPGEGCPGALRDRKQPRSSRNYDVSADGQAFPHGQAARQVRPRRRRSSSSRTGSRS